MGRSVQALQSESDVHSLVLRSIEPHAHFFFQVQKRGQDPNVKGRILVSKDAGEKETTK